MTETLEATKIATDSGKPRLRMRHAPCAIGALERDEWMPCMRQALAEQVTDPAARLAFQHDAAARSTATGPWADASPHRAAATTGQRGPA